MNNQEYLNYVSKNTLEHSHKLTSEERTEMLKRLLEVINTGTLFQGQRALKYMKMLQIKDY